MIESAVRSFWNETTDERTVIGKDMTDEKRRVAIRKLIAAHTAANTASPEIALASLVQEGIYKKNGTLRVEFGGVKKKKNKAA